MNPYYGPGPQTTYGLVHGLPYGPGPRTTFRTGPWTTPTDPLYGPPRAQVVSLHIAISFAVALQYMKDREASWKARNFRSFPSRIQPILPWVSVPDFMVYLERISTDTNKFKRPNHTSFIAWLSHEWKVITFRNFSKEDTVSSPAIWLVLSAVRIFLTLTKVTVTAGNSAKIVVLVNFWEGTSGDGQPFPFLHFKWRPVSTSLSPFTFKWQGKSL